MDKYNYHKSNNLRMETTKASGTIEERRYAREEQKRKKEQEILEKIRVNEEELQIEVNKKKRIDDRIKEVKENTAEEYRKMVKAFEDKHGLTALKKEQSEIESKIKQCNRKGKKYGGCKHPKYARVDLRGYDNYHCQLCGYKQNDGGMSCW